MSKKMYLSVLFDTIKAFGGMDINKYSDTDINILMAIIRSNLQDVKEDVSNGLKNIER